MCNEGHQFYLSWLMLNVNRPCSATDTKCEPNILCHPCKKVRIIDLQCYNYCHLLSDISSKFLINHDNILAQKC